VEELLPYVVYKCFLWKFLTAVENVCCGTNSICRCITIVCCGIFVHCSYFINVLYVNDSSHGRYPWQVNFNAQHICNIRLRVDVLAHIWSISTGGRSMDRLQQKISQKFNVKGTLNKVFNQSFIEDN
jgi:hypothetical protein